MVMTPKLVKTGRFVKFLVNPQTDEECWCVGALSKFVEVPDATWYWLHGETSQWPDGSGARVEVGLDESGHPQYWNEDAHCYCYLAQPLKRYLRRLGCEPGQSIIIYFCLWYQE